uniref:Rpn family recombination-promoting nuclease/putative transposase n=1 Tax=Streptomyces sp. NBC_01401 TaxID=2903854 RepID=A0AAU3GS57_9ACTN
MVNSSHEAMHRIFQEDPGIFTRTFRTLGIPFPDTTEVSVLTTDLTETQPLERRLDTLLQVGTVDGRSYLLAVEAQGRKDPAKHSSWTYYLAHLHAKYGLDPVLLVVCQDESTARWAARTIHIGPPEWPSLTVRPLALGPHNVPRVTDPSAAARDVPLAAFSAITHGKDPNAAAILEALATALKTVDEETATIFGELTELGLGNTPAAQIWRDLMAIDLSFFRSESSQRLRAEGKADAVVQVLEERGITITTETRQRIQACTDTETLSRWLTRALTATTAQELFNQA